MEYNEYKDDLLKFENYLNEIFYNDNIIDKWNYDIKPEYRYNNHFSTDFQIQKAFIFNKADFMYRFNKANNKKNCIDIELGKINDFIDNYYNNKTWDFNTDNYKEYLFNCLKQYNLNTYYKTISSVNDHFVLTIAKHVFFKEYLENMLKDLQHKTEEVSCNKENNLNEKTNIDIESFLKTLFYDYSIEKTIFDDFVKLIKNQRIKTYNQKILFKNEQYLLLYIIENLETHKHIDIETNKFIIDNFEFPNHKPIKIQYLQSLSNKHTNKSDNIRTEIQKKFNCFMIENKPILFNKFNINTIHK